MRLKSPSSPWPTASCSMTPGQPLDSTMSNVPAGAGTASRLTSAWRSASSAREFPAVLGQELAEALAAAHAVGAGFLPVAFADHDRRR